MQERARELLAGRAVSIMLSGMARRVRSDEDAIHELQGIYGPLSISEHLVQKIWLAGEFGTDSGKLLDGTPLIVVHPGRWNRADGPDFLNAELWLGNTHVRGDVEIHLYQEDWFRHGHHNDPRYGNVVLHVVFFDPDPQARPATTHAGRSPAVFVLAPSLPEDMESYASEDEQHPIEHTYLDRQSGVGPPPGTNLGLETILEMARRRWDRKCARAKDLMAHCGARPSSDAWHTAILEVLGVNRNRVAMRLLSDRFDAAHMRESGWTEDNYFRAVRAWRMKPLRPCNHPRRRIGEYLRWIRETNDAVEGVRARLLSVPGDASFAGDVKSFRRMRDLGRFRIDLKAEALGGIWTGSRADTLVIDALLPLAAAQHPDSDFFALWFSWWAGDVPDAVRDLMTRLRGRDGLRSLPGCNGLCQALIEILRHQPGLAWPAVGQSDTGFSASSGESLRDRSQELEEDAAR